MNKDKLPKHVIDYMHKEGIWGRVYIPVPEHIKNKSQRNETIIKMAEHGVSKTTIARKMDVSRTTVYNVLNEREQG